MNNALDGLIAKVESGTATPADFRCLEVPMQDMRYTQMPHSARMAYKGSFDAALALLESARPGWTIRLTATVGGSKSWPYVHIFKMRETEDDPAMGANSSGYEGFCPARAALLAILRAMKEGKDA